MRYNLIPTILVIACLGTINSCGSVPVGKGLPLPPIQKENFKFNAKQEIVHIEGTKNYYLTLETWRKIDTMLINREKDRDTCRKMYEAQQ